MNKDTASFFRIYVVPILVILVVILIVPFVLLPQIERIKVKNKEVKEGQERLARLNKKISDLALVDENKESIMLLELEKVIPGDKKVPGVIVGVKNISGESKLDVTEMVFTPGRVFEGTQSATASSFSNLSKEAKKDLSQRSLNEKELVFIVKLRGVLENIKTFLTKLEGAKRLMGIDGIKTQRDEDNPGLYRFDLTISAPLSSQGTSGDVLSQPLPELTTAHETLFESLINLKGYTTQNIPTVPTGIENPFE